MSFNRVSTADIGSNAGAASAVSTEQIVRYTGYAVGATAVIGSVGVLTVVAPAQMLLAAGTTAGCTIAANRMRDGKPAIPSFGFGKSDDTQPVASVTAPTAVAA